MGGDTGRSCKQQRRQGRMGKVCGMSTERRLERQELIGTWIKMKEEFKNKYISLTFKGHFLGHLTKLMQENMTINEYMY